MSYNECLLSANLVLVGRLTLDGAALLHVCIHGCVCFPGCRGYKSCLVRFTQLVARSPVTWVVRAELQRPANQATTTQKQTTNNPVHCIHRACPWPQHGQGTTHQRHTITIGLEAIHAKQCTKLIHDIPEYNRNCSAQVPTPTPMILPMAPHVSHVLWAVLHHTEVVVVSSSHGQRRFEQTAG